MGWRGYGSTRGLIVSRPGACVDRLVSLVLEHVSHQLEVLLVVLDDQDQLVCHGFTGNVKVNVAPWPSWLLTQILPPWSSTNRRESVSPRPVPSCFLA